MAQRRRLGWLVEPQASEQGRWRGPASVRALIRRLDETERDLHVTAAGDALLTGRIEAATWHFRQLAKLIERTRTTSP